MTAPLPPNPPTGWSADEFDKLIAALAAKAGVTVKATTKMVTPWRWTAGTGVFDGVTKSIRDNLEGLVKFTNSLKGDVDSQGQAIIELRADVEALKEAPPARPFP